jgi:hypothetical protein
MGKSLLLQILEAGEEEDRARRVSAAEGPPAKWMDFASAPKDGTLVDLKFRVEDAEPGAAEFFAPGCTCTLNPTEPIIENYAFVNGSFRGVVDAAGAQRALALGGVSCSDRGLNMTYGITSVSLTHWRPAAYPYID